MQNVEFYCLKTITNRCSLNYLCVSFRCTSRSAGTS